MAADSFSEHSLGGPYPRRLLPQPAGTNPSSNRELAANENGPRGTSSKLRKVARRARQTFAAVRVAGAVRRPAAGFQSSFPTCLAAGVLGIRCQGCGRGGIGCPS